MLRVFIKVPPIIFYFGKIYVISEITLEIINLENIEHCNYFNVKRSTRAFAVKSIFIKMLLLYLSQNKITI